MTKITFTLCFLLSVLLSYAQPNNLCASAISLNSQSACNTTAGTLASSTYTTVAGACGASSGNRNDVWYRFTAQATQATITVSGALTAPRFQVYTDNCGTPASIFCSTGGSAAFSGLTPGTSYLVRVYCNSNSNTTFNICITHPGPTRMREVFADTVIASNAASLNSPWEITYGSDGYLWITESKNFLIRRLDPNQRYTATPAASTTVLDLTSASWATGIRRNYTVGATVAGTTTPDPQGGLMGLALHPEFNTNPAKRFVYVACVRQYLGQNQTYAGETVNGHLFMNNLVRFTYNTGTGLLVRPVVLCDTLSGSKDHNSGRLIIAPVSGVNYLFYAEGDMGAGQFANISRTIKSQLTQSYEGKILRFNLEPDNDTDQGTVDYNQWIPDDNPYNNIAPVVGQSAVYSTGHRNVQGLALIGNTLYGASHGPFSDDEVNVLEGNRNYGHPRVIGYSADGNYNNAKAGPITSSLPLITSESTEAASLSNYKDPIYSFHPAPAGNMSTAWSIQYIYNNVASSQNANQFWASIAPSGMDGYNSTVIPGWKNSLLLASLKKGYMMRIKPNATNTGVESIGGSDTAAVFNSQNRFRDLTFAPNGKDIYAVIDRSGSTSGPTSDNAVSSACAGCIIKYTFLGYNHSGGTSTIPTSIPIDAGNVNNCATGASVTINSANNNTNLWVPLTGPDGNIVAEINANGNNLGNVTSSFYTRTGAARQVAGVRYMNRNITISVQNQPISPSTVSVRLYLTATELQDMINTAGSGVTSINDVGIYKNDDACGASMTATPTSQTITGRYTQGSFGHALQANISSFSTFYFMSTSSTLPANVITFKAAAFGDAAKLQWTVEDQINVERYIIERSSNNISYTAIGSVDARGNANERIDYQFTDINAAAFASTVYYRIKIADKDGSAKYTNVVPVSFENYTRAFVSVKPNPVVNNATVLVTSITEEMAQLRITDNTGRIVFSKNIRLLKGRNSLELNVSSLPAGLYYVDVTGKNIHQKTKLVKQ